MRPVDHQLLSVYCHCDGDPPRIGRYLLRYYATPDKACALIQLGDLDSVGKRLAPNKGERHTLQHPVLGEALVGLPVELLGLDPRTHPERVESVTTAYHRDWGEPLRYRWNDTTGLSDEQVTCAMGRTIFAEYYYVYRQGQWLFFDDRKKRFVPLTPESIVEWVKWLDHEIEKAEMN